MHVFHRFAPTIEQRALGFHFVPREVVRTDDFHTGVGEDGFEFGDGPAEEPAVISVDLQFVVTQFGKAFQGAWQVFGHRIAHGVKLDAQLTGSTTGISPQGGCGQPRRADCQRFDKISALHVDILEDDRCGGVRPLRTGQHASIDKNGRFWYFGMVETTSSQYPRYANHP